MSMKAKIFNRLVVEGQNLTGAQLAAQLGTTRTTVAARISEIRNLGYAIYCNRQVDSKGRVKYFYNYGAPTRSMVAAGRQALKGWIDVRNGRLKAW